MIALFSSAAADGAWALRAIPDNPYRNRISAEIWPETNSRQWHWIPIDHAAGGGADMRRSSLVLAILSVLLLPAHAADPAGEWRVEDQRANVRIAVCGGQLWGVVSREAAPGTDKKNPDPALRNRPTLGMPIILGMSPASANRWQGSIYNPEDGKTYRATVTLKGPDRLEVEGCVWNGWVCDSETWTRIRPPPWSVGTAPADAGLCARLGVVPRPPHERRQK